MAIFALPSTAPLGLKIGFAFVSYLLWDFSYTVCDAPIYALTTAMTDNPKERAKLISGARDCATIAMIALAVLVPQMYPKLGWLPTIAILAVAGLACMLPISFLGKERYTVKKEKGEETSFKDIWQYLKGNKYLKIFYLGIIIANVLNTSASVGNFFAIYCLGSEDMITVVTLLTVVPMLIMAALLPLLNKKWDKFTIYRAALIINCGLGAVTFFVGYGNFTVFVVLTLLRNLGAGAVAVMSYMFVTDCVEYGTFATQKRAEGITFSIQTFTTKLTGALSGAIGLYLLAAFNFVEGGAIQPGSALSAIWWLITLIPAAG
jgi:probable glucitol transport protein GutA